MSNVNRKNNWTEIKVETDKSDDLEELVLDLNDNDESKGSDNKGARAQGAQNEDKEDFSERSQNKGGSKASQEASRETGLDDESDDDQNIKPSRAFKRIKNLLGQRQELATANAEKDEIIQKQQEAIVALAKKAKAFEKSNVSSQKTQWGRAVESAEQALEKAISDNDPKEISKATKTLADAQMKFSAMEAVEEDFNEEPEVPEVPQQRKQSQQAPQVPEAAQEWVERNPWFFKDKTKHLIARSISSDLTQEGKLDPESDEYWDELDKRLGEYNVKPTEQRQQQQQERQEAAPRRRGSPVGSSRSNDEDYEDTSQFQRKGNRVSATPTQGDIDMADRLGVPLNDFMKEKFKYASQGYKGYVTIDIP